MTEHFTHSAGPPILKRNFHKTCVICGLFSGPFSLFQSFKCISIRWGRQSRATGEYISVFIIWADSPQYMAHINRIDYLTLQRSNICALTSPNDKVVFFPALEKENCEKSLPMAWLPSPVKRYLRCRSINGMAPKINWMVIVISILWWITLSGLFVQVNDSTQQSLPTLSATKWRGLPVLRCPAIWYDNYWVITSNFSQFAQFICYSLLTSLYTRTGTHTHSPLRNDEGFTKVSVVDFFCCYCCSGCARNNNANWWVFLDEWENADRWNFQQSKQS